MELYPICLKLKGVLCLVIGGGNVALRKVKSLIKCQARIIVVSPELCKGFKSPKIRKNFIYKKSVYKKYFLKKAFIIIAATDNKKTNLQIAKDAHKKDVLINVVDQPDLCNFYVPAVVKKGSMLASITTSGIFPGLAKKIKKDFSGQLNKYAKDLKILSKLRDAVKKEFKNKQVRKNIIQRLLEPAVLELIENKKIKHLRDLKAYLNSL